MSHIIPSPDTQIRTVLRRILLLNLSVALAKLAVGFLTGSVAIIADGFHSLVDGASNVVALIAQRIAAQPPDDDHPYGHRRFEAVATFVIGGFLLLTAWEVLGAAIDRLWTGGAPEVLPLSFGVLLATLVVNIGVVTYERRAAARLSSRVLRADADHTLTDIFVTCSVIIGLGLVSVGAAWADAVVGLVIVVIIARIGWRIISDAITELVDSAPLAPGSIEAVVLDVPSIHNVQQVRSRGAGDEIHVDLRVGIAREITAEHADHLRQAVCQALGARFPAVREVTVSFVPDIDSAPDYTLRARAAADGLGLGVHEVIVIPTDVGLRLEMHVEVSRGISLQRAHQQATELENRLTNTEDIHEVVTHIEPESGYGAPLAHTGSALQLRDEALSIAERLHGDADWHDAAIRMALGGYALSIHCALPGEISVEEAHYIAEEVETAIRAAVPQIQRVTIHTEPR